jgi:hypothetical protein
VLPLYPSLYTTIEKGSFFNILLGAAFNLGEREIKQRWYQEKKHNLIVYLRAGAKISRARNRSLTSKS